MALPRTYDDLLTRYGGAVPLAFWRALIAAESAFLPSALGPDGKSGLTQIRQATLTDYNKVMSTSWTLADLRSGALAAENAIRVGSWRLNAVVEQLARLHPLSFAPSWVEARYCELVALAWNLGASETTGVGHV